VVLAEVASGPEGVGDMQLSLRRRRGGHNQVAQWLGASAVRWLVTRVGLLFGGVAKRTRTAVEAVLVALTRVAQRCTVR
jgi:hypothetical protein